MGLFKRNSKNAASEKDEYESVVSVNSARTSNTSLRSPGYKGSGLPVSIPELPISKPPDPALDPAAYLRSIHAVRERASLVLGRAKCNRLNHFDVDLTKFKATASYVVSIIKVKHCLPTPKWKSVSNPYPRKKSATMRLIMKTFRLMAAGSISTSAGGHALISFCSRGPAVLTPRSEPVA